MVNFDEKKYIEKFGANFRNIRKSKNYTQERLAIETDLDLSYISRIERGLINITVVKLKRISDTLKIPLADFFNFDQIKLTDTNKRI